jgi:RNA polymerase sigma factor (sigma-70 family)
VDQAGRRRLQDDLCRLADGDRTAFHPVFTSLLPLLRRFTSRALPAGESDDAAQEALLKIYLRASEFDRERDALSWCLGIAAYEIKTHRRKKQRRRESGLEESGVASHPDAAPSPEQQAISDDLDVAIDAALRALGPADTATLRAWALGERPDGVAPATFRKRLERGLERLRALWRVSHGGR